MDSDVEGFAGFLELGHCDFWGDFHRGVNQAVVVDGRERVLGCGKRKPADDLPGA